MKPANFPARKVIRQIDANRDQSKPYTHAELAKVASARTIRTKKNRANERG